MKLYDPKVRRLLDRWPGKKTFGIYRFLPLFFVLGAALEFSMINWRVGEVNFYHTYKKREAQNILEKRQYESQLNKEDIWKS
ncbi:small integral membrane protein 4 [Anthonomus grandis grandis]|uniref:small integral membrane protein 4 n=1 Tax=Anthonomus grandis grandis TaxID=2921223 RepID=UPI0021658809|nr:small integral membrane protein 4 [Anthonomus grandis grandis]